MSTSNENINNSEEKVAELNEDSNATNDASTSSKKKSFLTGFSKKESGTLLCILAAVLMIFSIKNVAQFLTPATNLNATDPTTLKEGMMVSINPTDNFGVCYYDSSYGIFTEMKDGAREYSRAHLVVIADPTKQGAIVTYPVETSDKSIQKKLESISTNKITNLTFKGKLVKIDEDRIIDAYYALVMNAGYDANAGLTEYYILVDNPLDDILMFVAGIASLIGGTFMLRSYRKDHPEEFIKKDEDDSEDSSDDSSDDGSDDGSDDDTNNDSESNSDGEESDVNSDSEKTSDNI